MATISPSESIGHGRLQQVFRYLEALNQHRNPVTRQIAEQPWALWFRDLPDHPAIRRAVVAEDGEDGEGQSDSPTEENDFVLKVSRPKLTPPPSPPESLSDWLERGWEDPRKEVRLRESLNRIDALGETEIESFDEDDDRRATYEEWIDQRQRWAENERPALEAMGVFERLYELHGHIQREAEKVELVLGDGILNWRRPEGGVHHPVLLKRLQLEFIPSVPEFRLTETQHDVELYTALFNSISNVDGRVIADCRRELESSFFHPLGGSSTDGFLRSLVARLSSKGQFVGETQIHGESDEPRIGRDPVIFMRSRALGFSSAIESVLQDVKQRGTLPEPMLRVVGVESRSAVVEPLEGFEATGTWCEPEEVLLGKPANPEQTAIALRLSGSSGVIVQGPPGTGKTYTIANLIGHLLAEGKSVLVTSHTTKALRVLRKYVAQELRSLCVSVLASDNESNEQLKDAVEGIVARLSSSDVGRLSAHVRELGATRSGILAKLLNARNSLVEARANEYRDVAVAGKSFSPSDAARKVAAEVGKHDWIPSPVVLGEPLPLSEAELCELYATNGTISAGDETELSGVLPKPESLPVPSQFEVLVDDLTAPLVSDSIGTYWTGISAVEPQELDRLLGELHKAVEPLFANETWRLAVIEAGHEGATEPWDRLVERVDELRTEAQAARETILEYRPTVVEDDQVDQLRIVDEIVTHLDSGRSIGAVTLVVHPSWKKLVAGITVKGRPPKTREDYEAVRQLLRLRGLRSQLVERWQIQMTALGAPSLDREMPEVAASQFTSVIRNSLGWNERTWEPLLRRLDEAGFDFDKFFSDQPPNLEAYGNLMRSRAAVVGPLAKLLRERISYLTFLGSKAAVGSVIQTLEGAGTATQVVTSLHRAVTELDKEGYRRGYERLVYLCSQRSALEKRLDLLQRLEAVAPAWSSAVRHRSGVHGDSQVPGDANAAWLWRQLNDELDNRSSLSMDEIRRSIESLSDQFREVTTELIEAKAWSEQLRRMTLERQMALVGYSKIVELMGKRTGKRVPRLLADARKVMQVCRAAVPVWVMPLSRVAESFDPASTRFDVVIIDEASQCDVMGLIAVYIGKQVLVVGDDEQVSPVAIGQDQDIVQKLIDEHLQGIPNSTLYDGRMSIYDLAKASFGTPICLLEHFRCVPDIIQFSNSLSYSWRIKPLRDEHQVMLKPHVIAHRVLGGTSNGKVNKQEASSLASLLLAAAEQPEYEGKTFGAISLVGDEQAFEIDRLVRRGMSHEEHEKREIVCGNAAHFQGDERDVMFLSVVDGPADGPLRLREAGYMKMYKKRLNVAASRARDQMWVVYSLDPRTDLKEGDLRRRLIEYAEDPQALAAQMERLESRAQSEFEKLVLRRLVAQGYRIVPQWKVGYYSIDLVVVDGGKPALAIECDGDRYHPIEKIAEDNGRQAILERLGWRFARIRGSQFFRYPDEAMEQVFKRLAQLDITPEGYQDEEEQASEKDELYNRIVRRASEIRRGWAEDYGEAYQEVRLERPPAAVEEPGQGEHTIPPTVGKSKGRTAGGEPRKPAARQPAREGQLELFAEEPSKKAPPNKSESIGRTGGRRSRKTDQPEVITSEDRDNIDWTRSVASDVWFSLAGWAKKQGLLQPWERALSFSLGRIAAQDRQPTTKQARHGRRIYQEARERGFGQ